MVIKVKNNGEWVKIPYLSSDNNPVIPEAPLDGKQYARQNGEWTVVNIPEVDFTEINKKISDRRRHQKSIESISLPFHSQSGKRRQSVGLFLQIPHTFGTSHQV